MTSDNERPTADDPRDLELDRRLAALTRSADPAPSNWQAIHRRIHSSEESSVGSGEKRRWPLAIAAAAVLAIATVVLRQAPDAPDADFDAGRVLVQNEVEAMRRSAPLVTGGLEETPPLIEAWAENQTAIEELEAALDRDPDNRLLLEFLAEARLRQVRLLNSGLARFPRTDV